MTIPESYVKLGADPQGAKPVAAVLRVGKKGPKGNPTEASGQDAGFYVVRAEAIGSGHKLTRPPHGAFSAYNDAPPFDRRSFKATLPYSELTRCWEQRRTAKEIRGFPKHPSRFVTCQSVDGETADRLYQLGAQTADTDTPEGAERIDGTPEDEHWYRVPCDGDLCPYAQRRECHSNATLYLISDEPDCPHVLIRFYTGGGVTTVKRIAAFFDDTAEMARGMGLELDNWLGLPVVLNLGQGQNKKEGRRYPVVTLALREAATLALKAQREAIEGAGGRLELPPAVIDGEVIPVETEEAKAHDAIDAAPGVPQSIIEGGEQGSLL